MPQAEAPTSEQTITVPLKFVEEIHTFASHWLADFTDYANDDFGDDEEQTAREQEVTRLRYLAETSEALLLPPATQEQFQQWLSELAQFGNELEISPLPDETTEPSAAGLRVKLNTEQFSCAIVAIWEPDRHDEIYTYLGATGRRRGDGNRNLAQGPITRQTWRRILKDIAALNTDAHDDATTQPA